MSILRVKHNRVVRWLRRLFIVLAALFFALSATAVVALFGLRVVLSDRDRLHTIVDEVDFGQRGYALTADFLLQTGGAEVASVAGSYPPQTWRAVAQRLLPAGWLEEHAHRLTDAILVWLERDAQSVPAFTADLSPLRQRLQGSEGAQIILPLLQDRPPCAEESGAGAMTVLQDGIVSCLPPAANLNDVGAEIATVLATRLPAQVTFDELESGVLDAVVSQSAGRLQIMWSSLNGGFQLAFRLSLFFIVFYALFFASSSQRLIEALPWPLYSAGLLSLALLVAAQIFVSFGLQTTVSGLFPRFGGEAQLLLVDLVGQILNAGRLTWGLFSFTLLFLAGALHGSLRLWRRYRIAKEEQEKRAQRPRRSHIRRQYR